MTTATLPWSWYDDPEILDREHEKLFASSWQYVGHIGMLEGPAGYFPANAGSLPVVVTRDREGELHSLVNVCAHRGSIVCDEPAARDTLRCPYHAWTYRLDGSLLKAPRSDREAQFDASAHSLTRLRVDAWGPFIFVATAPEAPLLADTLSEVPDRVAELIDVEELVFSGRTSASYRANWKVCAENYLECYHCRVAHPSFSSVVETGPDDYRLVPSEWGSSQYGPIRRSWTGAFDPGGPVGRSQFHFVYPNTTINIFPGYPNISIGPVIPSGAGRTNRFLDYFFGPDVDPSWTEGLMKLDDEVGREDLELVEAVQRGMEARARSRGTLFVDSEELIAHFRDYVREGIGNGTEL